MVEYQDPRIPCNPTLKGARREDWKMSKKIFHCGKIQTICPRALRFGSMINFQEEHQEMDFEGWRLFLEQVMKPSLIKA